MKRTANIPSEMRAHYASWQSSAMSKKKYCEAADLGYHTFLYWVEKLSLMKTESADFTPIVLPAVIPGNPEIEIVYPHGITVRLYRSYAVDIIKSLL